MRNWWFAAFAVAALFVLTAQTSTGPLGGMVSTHNALQALAPGQYAEVTELGYSTLGDIPPVNYSWAATCPGPVDGGQYIAATSGGAGGCWAMFAQTIYDPRWWGHFGQVQQFIAASPAGTDAGFCLSLPTQCATWQYAVNKLLTMTVRNQTAIINVGAGTFAGGVIAGMPFGASNNNRVFVYTLGAGPGQTIFNSGGATYPKIVFETDSSAYTDFGNITVIAPGGGGVGLWAANSAYITLNSGTTTEIIGTDNSSLGEHTESNGIFEVPKLAPVSIKGTFANVWNPDNFSNFLADGNAITCEGTVTFTQYMNIGNGGNSHVAPSQTYSGCSGAVGDLLQMYSGGTLENQGPDFPGNGYINSSGLASAIYPPYRPTLGTCANGVITANSDNSTMYVTISGTNSSCIVNMGKPLTPPAAGYYKHAPVCSATAVSTTATPVSISYPGGNDAIMLRPASALTSGGYTVLCHPAF